MERDRTCQRAKAQRIPGLIMAAISNQAIARIGAWWAVGVALCLGALYGYRIARLPCAGQRPGQCFRSAPGRAWAPPVLGGAASFDASVFRKRADHTASAPGPLAKRFRLAGTFFAMGGSQQVRKAILDDLQGKEQALVSEGDVIDGDVAVLAIGAEKIVVRAGGRDEELHLSFAGQAPPPAAGEQNEAASAVILNRFGRRVGETRWVLQRDALLKYYAELLNNTDRLAKVFDSLKPVYQAGKIAGYALVVEGEGDMFSALGLRPNDVIRSVNKVPMISQSRAEYFIREFVNNRANGFVLGIEREGNAEQLIYLIR